MEAGHSLFDLRTFFRLVHVFSPMKFASRDAGWSDFASLLSVIADFSLEPLLNTFSS